jgi:hypothetical protein
VICAGAPPKAAHPLPTAKKAMALGRRWRGRDPPAPAVERMPIKVIARC